MACGCPKPPGLRREPPPPPNPLCPLLFECIAPQTEEQRRDVGGPLMQEVSEHLSRYEIGCSLDRIRSAISGRERHACLAINTDFPIGEHRRPSLLRLVPLRMDLNLMCVRR
jgi:hypothetical protein